MSESMALVGLDVHQAQSVAAVLDLVTGELRVERLRGAPGDVVPVFLEGLGQPARAVYEAGPTGFALARAAAARGLDLRVVSPGSIPKAPGDRVKTDRRDAKRLVRLFAAGELSFSFVPSEEEERFRDLVRCIDDARVDLMRSRHRLSKFLLRRGLRFAGRAWTQPHQRWLGKVVFDDALSRACDSRVGEECACKPTYQAHVWSAQERKRIRKTFPTFAAAKAWRHDASVALRKGTMKAPTRITLKQAAEAWIDGARDGSIRNRSGDSYKPSAVRGYEQALRLRVVPDLGPRRLSELRRNDFQDLVDRLVSKGADPSTVRNTLMPVRAIFRRAVARGDVATNPTTGLELPAVRGVRERIATPDEAAALIAAVPIIDRAMWATAMYTGLRLGELMALDWSAVDFEVGVIRVERSWDPKEGVIEPKSRAGRRGAPIPSRLRPLLREHRLRQGRAGRGLVFGRAETRPFNPPSVQRRARIAWSAADLTRITPHECRHTFASMMIAAGINAKTLSTYMGHANIAITMDRYGHLMPGNEQESAGLLDAYLEGTVLSGGSS